MKVKVSRGAGFGGLLKYVFDDGAHEHSLKDPEIVSTNMFGKSSAELAAEFGAVRRLRSDIEKPVWHASLSLPPGESISKEKWDQVVRDFMTEMGLDPNNHQFVAAIHRDTEHEHVHIVANRIGLDSKVWLGQREALVAIKATAALEKRHGLRITKTLDDNNVRLHRALSDGELELKKRAGEEPQRLELARLVRQARDESVDLAGFLGSLESRGVRAFAADDRKQGGLAGLSYEYKNKHYMSSRIGHDLKWSDLSAAIGFDVDRDQALVAELLSRSASSRAEDAEARVAAIQANLVEELADAAREDLFARSAVITMRQMKSVIRELKLRAPEHARQVVEQLRGQLRPLGDDGAGAAAFSIDSILTRERKMIEGARLLAGDRHHDLTEDQIAFAIEAKELEASSAQGRVVTMTDEQRDAVRRALKGGISIVQGSAGAGKSFSMEAVRLGYESRGYQVLGAAVSRRAAQNLETEAGIKSRTVAKLLSEIRSGSLRLDRRTMVVVDEAGQVGSDYLAELVVASERAGAKLVLTGEDRQLDSIHHGGGLRFLSRPEVVGTARIQAIQRQHEAWARAAVADYRDGSMGEGLQAFDDHGLVRWERGGTASAMDALVSAWRDYELSNPDKQSLILAHSNANARALGARVREIRKAAGRITGPEYRVPAEHGGKAFDLVLAAGDRVRFGLNSEGEDGIGAINGTTGTVTSIRPVETDGRPDFEISVLTDDRGEIVFRASRYSDERGRVHLNQAYALSVYSAQGVTTRGDVFVLQTPGMDRSNTYVAASRARENTHTFVDAQAYLERAAGDDQAALRAALVESMGRERGGRLATEVLSSNDADYLAKAFGAQVDPVVRAERDARLAAPEEGEAEELKYASYDELRDACEAELFGRDSVVTTDRVEEALIEFSEIAPEHEARLRADIGAGLVALGVDQDGRELRTIQRLLDRELQLVRDVRTLVADRHHDLSQESVESAIHQLESETAERTGRPVAMSAEQRDAVVTTLRTAGGWAALQGSAGAGKSFSMSAVRIAYEREGYQVIGAAIAKRAAQNLQDEAGIKSHTVSKILTDLRRGSLKLDHRTVLIVDEAGQVGAGNMAQLAAECRSAGAKIVLSGEDKQLDAIMHGGVLRFTSREDVAGAVRIEAIQRQREQWAREAVMNLRDGRVAEGLQAYEDRGLIRWVRGGLDQTHARLIDHWRRYEMQNPSKQSIIITHSKA